MRSADAAVGRRPLAIILGVAGERLSPDERRFFAGSDPLGFVLFRRNCVSRDQVRALVDELRDAVGRADAPVLIDQEGGRVARLRPPEWRAYPAAAAIAALPDPMRARSGASGGAADRRRARRTRHHRRCRAGPRPAGRRAPIRSSATAPGAPTRRASRRSGARSAKGCWPAACCRSSSTSRDTAAPASTATRRCRGWTTTAPRCREPISRRFARWPTCPGR